MIKLYIVVLCTEKNNMNWILDQNLQPNTSKLVLITVMIQTKKECPCSFVSSSSFQSEQELIASSFQLLFQWVPLFWWSAVISSKTSSFNVAPNMTIAHGVRWPNGVSSAENVVYGQDVFSFPRSGVNVTKEYVTYCLGNKDHYFSKNAGNKPQRPISLRWIRNRIIPKSLGTVLTGSLTHGNKMKISLKDWDFNQLNLHITSIRTRSDFALVLFAFVRWSSFMIVHQAETWSRQG